MLGIEFLKQGILSIVLLGMEIEKALQDKRIKFGELLGMFPEAKDVYEAFENWEQMKLEYEDMDDSERDAIEEFVIEQVDLENDTIEDLIEIGFEWVLVTDDFISTIRKAKKTHE